MDASRRPERLWSDTRRNGALQPIKDAPTASLTADEFPCRQHGQARIRHQARQRHECKLGGAAAEFTRQAQSFRGSKHQQESSARCLPGQVLHTGTNGNGAPEGPDASPASCYSRPCH